METSDYTEEDYPARFLKGYSIFQSDERIYHHAKYQYDFITSLREGSLEDGIFRVKGRLASGEEVSLSVEAASPDVLRLKMWQGMSHFEEESAMLVNFPKSRETIRLDESESVFILTYGGYRLQLQKIPFSICLISPKGETIFESETEQLVGLFTAPPLGFRIDGEKKWAFLSWRMRNQDRFYGLGEKFTKFERTSSRATIWEADTCGSNTCDMSYKAVPVLFSTAGWGLMAHTSFRSYWEIGSFSYSTGSGMIEDNKLDLFLMLASSLKQGIELYTGLTGRPSMPPKWAMGLWMSRAPYRNQHELREVAERLRKEEIPCDVFNLDPTWLTRMYYNDIGVEVCNFEWNEATFGKPEALFSEFAGKGFSICLWINPYFSEDSAAYAEAKEKGYLVKSPSGGISRLEYNLAAGMVDFTNPAAREWWKGKLIDLLHKGASVFKVDFGDRVPEDALFYNGKTGLEMHNLYVHLYAGAVFEAVKEGKGIGMVWRRPGYIGSQRYPGCWAGDTQVTWEGMKGALRGGLSAAMTGESFWSHDMGGFVGPHPSPELYIRWAQWGLLSPLSRFHGITPREPWNFGETAVEVVRRYAQLRYMLIPYLLSVAQDSTQTGLPILRPMALEFPEEPHVDALDDQYMLGPDLLVAPVFVVGARQRKAYIPAGQWRCLENPEFAIDGPGYREVDASLERIPVFVRPGAVIPRYTQAPQQLKSPTPEEWALDIFPGVSQRKLVIPETSFRLEVAYESDGTIASLNVSPAPIRLTIRRFGEEETTLDARQGIEIKYSG
jgi:alpha-D-xyloside xylohydrolase